MPKLITHRPHPPPPCAPTKRRSQICLVDRVGSPKTRDHRSRGRSRDILPRGRSTGTRRDVHPLLGRGPQFRTPSSLKCALSLSTIRCLDALRRRNSVRRCLSPPTTMRTTTNASMTRLMTRITIPCRLPTPHPNHSLKWWLEIKTARFGLPNEKWNDRNMLMTYDRSQSHPSPHGMGSYESIDPNSPTFRTDVFIDHDQIDVSSQPCFSGDRVRSYENIINL